MEHTPDENLLSIEGLTKVFHIRHGLASTRFVAVDQVELALKSLRSGKPGQKMVNSVIELQGAKPGKALVQEVLAEQSLAKHTYSAYLPATVVLTDALRRAGQFDQAVDAARALVDQFATRVEIGMYPPECWWLIHRALDAGGDRAGARAALHRGAHWVQATAEARVPDEFRSSFLERNPVNRGLLTTLTRTP